MLRGGVYSLKRKLSDDGAFAVEPVELQSAKNEIRRRIRDLQLLTDQITNTKDIYEALILVDQITDTREELVRLGVPLSELSSTEAIGATLERLRAEQPVNRAPKRKRTVRFVRAPEIAFYSASGTMAPTPKLPHATADEEEAHLNEMTEAYRKAAANTIWLAGGFHASRP
jgi:hypothetical protein